MYLISSVHPPSLICSNISLPLIASVSHSSIYLSFYLCICRTIQPKYLSINCLSIHLICLPISLSFYPSIHLSISIYNRCIHLYVCLSVHPSVISFCLSLFLSLMSTVYHLCLSVCLSVIYLCLSSIQSIIHRRCPYSFCRYPRSSDENPPDETLSYLRKGCSPRDGAETWPLLPPSRK